MTIEANSLQVMREALPFLFNKEVFREPLLSSLVNKTIKLDIDKKIVPYLKGHDDNAVPFKIFVDLTSSSSQIKFGERI